MELKELIVDPFGEIMITYCEILPCLKWVELFSNPKLPCDRQKKRGGERRGFYFPINCLCGFVK